MNERLESLVRANLQPVHEGDFVFDKLKPNLEIAQDCCSSGRDDANHFLLIVPHLFGETEHPMVPVVHYSLRFLSLLNH
jgi:hypothetical protein